MMKRLAVLAVCVFPTLPSSATAQVGSVEFPNSGSIEAQESFLRGVALLHNFEYGSAAEAFREAQGIDPDFALAYWGEAMTYNHPIWLEQDSTAARDVLARLAPTRAERLAAAGTEHERAYMDAVEILYGEAGSKQSRDFAYAEAMRGIYEAYPSDLEAAAFYALSILGTAHRGRETATYMRAAAIVEKVFDADPTRPWASGPRWHTRRSRRTPRTLST
jgi:tetratricopeptide (TPR) repeat protein